jgi:membrane peptidoglycan carboxypeptidase
VYAQLTAEVGPRNVVKMAHALGITSPLHSYFGIGLGVEAVNPLEMARAFGTFADNGARIDGRMFGNEPRAILAVGQGGRRAINDAVKRQVLDPNDDALLTSILETVVAEGTGVNASLGERPAAGKTGTTENYGDAWFVGYTPQLAAAVWVGYPNRLKPMLTDYRGGPVAGGTYPALIWKTFMKRALAKLHEPPEYFPTPTQEYAAPAMVVNRSGKLYLDNGNCRDAREIVFVSGFAPKKEAPCKVNEVHVPDVVGMKLADAKSRPAGTPLSAEVITRPAKPGERLGIVVSQDPAGGTLSSFGTVRVVLPRALYGVVPKVVGLPLLRARAILAQRRLVPVVDAYADGERGVVLAQIPKPWRAAGKSLEVRLIVGRG